MTTLPQTTTVRLPRTAGAVGPGGLPMLAGHAPAPAGMTGGDVVRVLRSNLWLILGALVLSIVVGYGLNKFLSDKYPRYTAVALVEVNNGRHISDLHDMQDGATDVNALNVEQKTEVALLKSDWLISHALGKADSKIRQTQWFKQFNNNPNIDPAVAAKQDFYDRYTVTALPDTNLVKIEFEWSDPQEARDILEEVVDTHILQQQDVQARTLAERTATLTGRYNELVQEAQNKSTEVNQLSSELSNEGGGTLGMVGVKDIEIQQIIHSKAEMDMKLQDARSQYESVGNSLKMGIDPAPVQKLIDANLDVHALKMEYDKAQAELDAITGTYGPNSGQVKGRMAARDNLQQKYEDALTEAQTKARAEVMDELQRAVTEASEQVQSLSKQEQDLRDSITQLTSKTERYLIAREQQKAITEEVKEYHNRIEDISNEIATSKEAKVAWNTRPDKPNVPSFPKLWMVMTVSVSLGLVLSLGIAFLREMTDQTVRSPRDIARVGQMNLLGMVPEESDDPQAAGARLPLVIFDAPHSMTAEQLRQVRTRLQHAASLDTTRSIMVTSPSPGDGKTTIACNLAAGLALNGRRILLVDSNFRRPEIHRIFGLGNDHGFSDVLAGALAFDQSVQETSVPNLSVMTAGPKPINATEMFESQLLIDFIERCLEEYDHVVFDAGPMMIVAEASAMAPRVDGVVSVVRARGNSRGLLQRMRDDLRKVKAEHLGVVLNAVRAHGGGYYGRNIKTYYEYQNG